MTDQPARNIWDDVKRAYRRKMPAQFGLEVKPGGTRRNTPVLCPFCEDTAGTASINHYNDGDIFVCFSCWVKGDVFNVYREKHGGTRIEALHALAKPVGINPDEYEPASGPTPPPETRDEIVDCGPWLTANGATLAGITVYIRDDEMGLEIPFSHKGQKPVLVEIPWDCWHNVKSFRKLLAVRLCRMFSRYPKKATPLIQWFEAVVDMVGPGGVEDRSIAKEVELSMRDQFLTLWGSIQPFKPAALAEYARRIEEKIGPGENPPDFWGDVEDFCTEGQAATIYNPPGEYMIRAEGFLETLRGKYGGWKPADFIKIMKDFKFKKKRPAAIPGRKRVWVVKADIMDGEK